MESIVNSDKGRKIYLFIDEVQFTKIAKNTENDNIDVTIYNTLIKLKYYKNLDAYVTGSNSKILFSDFATKCRGGRLPRFGSTPSP